MYAQSVGNGSSKMQKNHQKKGTKQFKQQKGLLKTNKHHHFIVIFKNPRWKDFYMNFQYFSVQKLFMVCYC